MAASQPLLARQRPFVTPAPGALKLRLLPCTITRARSQPKVAAGKVEDVVQKIEKKLEEIDENVLQYCSLDSQGKRRKGKMSLGEKEAEFLNALRSFYYDDKPSMSNEEFDNLKEELLWEGSRVAVLSSTEQRFMEASLSSSAGKPILSDAEYDELKQKLQQKNSKVVQQGPRCSIRSRNVYSDANPDYLKMTLLNIPAILLGPCPNCNTPATTYFGDILTIPGNRELNSVVCSNCKSKLDINAAKRQILLKPGSDKKKSEPKKPAAKKEADSKKADSKKADSKKADSKKADSKKA